LCSPEMREPAPHAESRPPSTTTTLQANDVDRTQARCARCSHPISAPRSLETGYGKKCRRLLDADVLEGSEVVDHG
jgi:hypothetical protein